MGILLPLLVGIVPLLILPRWSFYFDVVPRVVLLLAIAAVTLVWGGAWRVPLNRRARRFFMLVILQGAAILLSTIFSTHREFSFFGSAWRKEGLLVELAILVIAAATLTSISADGRRLHTFLRITVLASLPAALYGILQYFGIDPWILAAGYHFGNGAFMIVRPPSTLGHAAYFATFLLYAVFAAIALAAMETGLWKTAAVAVAAIAGLAIVLSGTRAALLGAVMGAGFVVARDGLSAKHVRKAAAAGAVALAVLTAFYVSPAGERLRARAHWEQDDRLGGARLLLWRDTLRMAGSRWMAGYGPETFAVEFPKHESLELARAYPDFYHESPHNIFLDALISNGVLGFASLIAWSAFGLALSRGPIGGAFVAMLVSQQFTSFTAATELYFFITLAFLASDFAGLGVSNAPRTVFRYALAVPFACFAVYLAIGDATLASARRSLDGNDVVSAARQVSRARAWHASADIHFSRRFLTASTADPASRLRAWKYAFETARTAPETADDPMNAFVNLASFYAGEGDAVQVDHCLRSAIGVAPNWFKPHWLLAQVLALEGRKTEAEAEARAAAERQGKEAEAGQIVKRSITR
ncbi:MAG TPA: O-antigen ligase family protein [Bryobacteraceae bacterium]|nr:O-antigen ligase family protein [Bryobacteraceae bacterium]